MKHLQRRLTNKLGLLGLMLFFGVVGTAEAGSPLSSAMVRMGPEPEVGLVLGSAGTGVYGAMKASQTSLWNGELLLNTRDSVLELRVGRRWQLTRAEQLFGATAEVSGTVLSTVRGPLTVGIGPHAGIHAGLGRNLWEVNAGATVGAELFTDGGPRFPVRLELGAGGRLGSVHVRGIARVGQDVEVGHASIFRMEAGLLAGWIFE